MAKITDTSLNWFGSKYNAKQMRIAVPGGPTANTGGILFLECINSGGAATGGLYLHTDGTNLRISTSSPSNTNTGGDALGTSTGGANTALSNVAAVAISESLISDSVNTDDLGSDALPWKRLYIRTSLIFDQATRNLTITASEPGTSARTVNFDDPTANDSVAYLAASQALTTKTYNGLTIACASANQMIFTRGTATITLTEGNTDILLAAGAQLDIAGSKTVDIDQNFTVNTEAVTLNQSLSTTDDVTFDALTVTSVTDGTATLTGGALSGVTTIGTTAAITCKGITNTTTAISSTAAISIAADTVNLNLGATAQAKIYATGANMYFQDTTCGPYTLQQIATGTTLNPTVNGDLTILEGKLTWTDAADEVAAVWTLAGIANDSIQIVAAAQTTGNVLSITANGVTTNGALFYLASSLAAGYFAEFYNGSANVFTVGRYGATVIGGVASTDVLTLTAGDVKVTAGDIRLTDGIITVDMDADEISYFKKGFSTGAAAVVEIENTHVDSTGPCLLLDQNATGNAMALQITHDGDYAAIDISAPVARTGNVINITMANQLAQKAINITGAATSANNAGVIDVTVTGATAGALFYGKQSTGAPATTSHIFLGTSQGVLAGATLGAAAYFEEIGTVQAGSYALYATSTANNGALINTGSVNMYALHLTGPQAHVQSILYVDGATGSGWDGAAGVGMVQINSDTTNTFLAATASLLLINSLGTTAASQLGIDLRLVDVTTAGAGTSYAAYISTTNNYGLCITTGAVGGGNLVLTGIAAQAVPMITLTANTDAGWTGAATTGLIDITCDGTTAQTTASMINIKVGAGTPASGSLGYALRIVDTTLVSGTSYAAWISANANEALCVAAGKVKLAENLTIDTGGITVTAGGVTVTAGGVAVTGSSSFIDPTTYADTFRHASAVTETLSAAHTLDAADSGKILLIDTTAVITLPATAIGLTYTFVNVGADGGVQISVDPAADDMIQGIGLTAANNKDLINTLASAKHGDYVTIVGDGQAATGWCVTQCGGTWAREA